MINSISLNPKYNINFYSNKRSNSINISEHKLDVSIYGKNATHTLPFAPNYNVSFSGNKTYITGHRNPDTDSICSAIAVEYLANAIKTTDKTYKAIAPGEISPETQYILKYFGIDKPEEKKNVRSETQ